MFLPFFSPKNCWQNHIVSLICSFNSNFSKIRSDFEELEEKPISISSKLNVNSLQCELGYCKINEFMFASFWYKYKNQFDKKKKKKKTNTRKCKCTG